MLAVICLPVLISVFTNSLFMMVLSWDLKFPYSFSPTLKTVTSFFFFQSSRILLIFCEISEWFSEY